MSFENNRERSYYSADNAVKKLKQKYFNSFCYFAFLRFFIGWSLAFGFVVLFFRFININSHFGFWFLSGLPLAILFGIDYAIKHKVSDIKCFAAIDSFNEAGGLLISENELGDKSWYVLRKKKFEVPEVDFSFDKKHLFGLLSIALIFAISSFYVPMPKRTLFRSKKIDLTEKVNELKEQIELLEEEKIITTEEKKSLEESLDKIVESSDNESPGITFESLDQMKDKLQYEAEAEVKKRINDMQLLKKLEDYIKEAQKMAEDQKKVQEALDKFKNQLRKMGMSESEINDFLNKNFGGNASEQGLNRSQMNSYSRDLKDKIYQKGIENSELAEKLRNKDLIDQDTLEKFRKNYSENSNNSKDGLKEEQFFNINNQLQNMNKSDSESYNSQNDKLEKEAQLSQEAQNNKLGQQIQEADNGKKRQQEQEGQISQSSLKESNEEKLGQEFRSGQSSKQEQSGKSGQNGESEQAGESGESSQGSSSSDTQSNGSKQSGNSELDLGSGGIGKGGGYTPLTFGDKSSDHNVKYRDEVLPEIKKESAVDSVTIGIGIASPNVEKEKIEYNSMNFKSKNKEGNNLNNKNILPKYRNAVKNYFNH